VKEKLFPLNRPWSLNLSSGITSKAIKESVINGAVKEPPKDFAFSSSALYFFLTCPL